MKVKEIGEDRLIQLIEEIIKNPLRDDCAHLKLADKTLLVTTDMLVEGTHFRIPPFRHHQVGSKAILANISDIAATGGRPLWATVSLGVPGESTVEEVTELYRGIQEEASAMGCSVVGGDTCRAPYLVLSITVVGVCKCPVTRGGARPGDILAVTGTPGVSAVGLEALLEGYPEELFRDFIERHTKPRPPLEFAVRITDEGIPTSMLDISDGLIMDCSRLARESRVALEIDTSKLPPLKLSDRQKAFLKHPEEHYILHGGEEYQLVLTLPPEKLSKLEEIAKETSTSVTTIGGVTEGEGVYLIDRNRRVPAIHRGFRHF